MTAVAPPSGSIAIPSPPRRPPANTALSGTIPGARNPTGEWSKNAARHLEAANAEVAVSSHLRGDSEKHSATLFKQVTEQQQIVNDKLRKRIKECKTFRTKLQGAEKQLQAELAQLILAKEKAQTLKVKMARPLQKCMNRKELRGQRPNGENIEDLASKAIKAHAEGISVIQVALQSDIDEAARHVDKMQKHIKAVQFDIEHKTQAIVVDEDCLHFDLDPLGAPVPYHKETLSPTLPTAAEGPYGVLKSTTDPEHWKQISVNNLEVARNLSNAAKDIRAKILVDIKRFTEQQRTLNTEVMDSVGKRRTQTKQYVVLMEQHLRKLDDELSVLGDQKLRVDQALADKQRPLDIVKKRLEARVNRPGREAVRDEVEIELEKEFKRLVIAVEALQLKEKSIEAELQRLTKTRQILLDDHEHKARALELEQACIDIDAKTEYQIDTPMGTPRSGTPRESTPRIGTPRSSSGSQTPRLSPYGINGTGNGFSASPPGFANSGVPTSLPAIVKYPR